MNLTDKLYSWLLLFICYLPFQIALNLTNQYDLASSRIFILVFFIVCLFFLFKQRKEFFKKVLNWPSFLLLFFLIWNLISLIGSPNPIWGFRKVLYLISIFPIYLIVLVLIKNYSQIFKLIKYLIFSFSIFSLIGLLQFLAQFVFSLEKVYQFWAINILPIFSGFNLGDMILNYPSWLVNIQGKTLMRAFSLFSDPHMFSFSLGLIIPFSLIGIIIYRNKYLLINSYAIFILGIAFSFTRGAYLAVLLSLILLFCLSWIYFKNKTILILFLISLALFLIPVSPIADRFYSSFNLNEGSNLGRLEMWQQARKIGMNNFWQGVGLGNYSLVLDQKNYRNPATAHNFYLDLFSETGLIGLLAWFSLILIILIQLFKKLKNETQKNKTIIISLIGSLTYFSVHSFFETGIYQPVILSLFMILIGLSQFIYHHEKNN